MDERVATNLAQLIYNIINMLSKICMYIGDCTLRASPPSLTFLFLDSSFRIHIVVLIFHHHNKALAPELLAVATLLSIRGD
jgi:hypothetical protein